MYNLWMLVIFIFLLFLSVSAFALKKPKVQARETLKLTPAARVFVQPSFSENSRHFFEGQVQLLHLQDNASLLLRENATEPSYFLKSSEDYDFQSTVLTEDSKGRLSIHASLKDRSKVIVFRADTPS